MARARLLLYAAAHFLVDLSCALLILGRVCPEGDPAAVILLYNLFAFAVQMPVGLLADRLGRCHWFAAGGCLLVLTGWLLPPGLAAAVAAGLGNAAFHVGGGLDTLNSGEGKAGPLGLFVSPGAFGVYLGGRWAFSASALIVCLTLLAAAIVLALVCRGPDNAPLAVPQGTPRFWTAAGCLLAVVVLRSWLGLGASLPWKAGMGFAAVFAVAAGKAAGGYAADRFGMLPVAVTSLGLSALCFLGGNRPGLGLAALALFNMTMPLTLHAMARLLPGLKGFSFGLLTFGLFLGFLPVFYGSGGLGPAALAAGAAASLPPLVLGLRHAERGKPDAE